MKLDSAILRTLQEAVDRTGGAAELARKTGIDPANISRYLSGRVKSVSDDNWAKLAPVLFPVPQAPEVPGTIRNTPELRRFITEAMSRCGITDADGLRRRINYDNSSTIERLLAGSINFFPDILGAIFDQLGCDVLDAPISRSERALLPASGIYREGAILVRPIPVVDWANALGHLEQLSSTGDAVFHEWDPENTPTVPAPVGTRRDTQAFRVTGVSMEPQILDGDIIFVEPVKDLADLPNNKIVVAKFHDFSRFPECVICKRFRRDGELLCFSSDNPAGRFFTASASDLDWIGVVVRKISEL